jgi:hypothetical protein
MSLSETRLEFPEPERYELSEPPKYHFELNRREFVQVLGAGILVSVVASGWAQRAGGSGEPALQDRLHIGQDGTITIFTSKVECGQGSRTELTQAAAEELGVSRAQRSAAADAVTHFERKRDELARTQPKPEDMQLVTKALDHELTKLVTPEQRRKAERLAGPKPNWAADLYVEREAAPAIRRPIGS